MASPIDYLERGIHGYFPFGRSRRPFRTFTRSCVNRGDEFLSPASSADRDTFDFLEELADTVLFSDFDEALPPRFRRGQRRRRANPSLPAVRPGTRCTEPEHGQYYARVRQACKTRSFACSRADSINQRYAKAAIAQDCANARFAYQRRCFTRAHPDWTGHETARAQARRASRACWEMAQGNR